MKLLNIFLCVATFLISAMHSEAGPVSNSEEDTVMLEADDLLVNDIMTEQTSILANETSEATGISLQSVILQVDNETTIDFNDLKLESSRIVLTSAKPDLELLSINVMVTVETVQVTGGYRVVGDLSNHTSADLFSAKEGKVSLSHSDMAGFGAVGLKLDGTNFKAHDVEIPFVFNPTAISMEYVDENGESHTRVELIEDAIFKDLRKELNSAVNQELNTVLESEMNEVLQRIPTSHLVSTVDNKMYFAKMGAKINMFNSFVDEMLNGMKKSLDEHIRIGNVYSGFKKKILFITWHGKFEAGDGTFYNAKTLHLAGDVTLSQRNGNLNFVVPIRLSSAGFRYGWYVAKFMNIGPRGRISGAVRSNLMAFHGQLQFVGGKCTVVVQDFEVRDVGHIKMDVTGLGILNWILNLIAGNVVNKSKHSIVDAIRSNALSILRDQLQHFDCGSYFQSPEDIVSGHIVEAFNQGPERTV
ncbi:uncharacterized protein [Periplaneta americana]|uniref:uncharacterized protein n=1 Tax=Periplaneta americana TaxID=6978 RepID=UPI0037E71301